MTNQKTKKGFLAKMFQKDSQTDTKTKLVTQKSGPPPKPIPTTTIREKSDKVSWAIRNWRALEKTGEKEFRSPVFEIYFDGSNIVHKLRIVCKPQYNNGDGSIEAMTLKLETVLYDGRIEDSYEYVPEKGRAYYQATKIRGHFRFETADDSTQITIDDESGTAQSQFFKDGSPRVFGICDANDVNFQMKGLSSPDFEVTLFFKVLFFIESK